MVESILALGSNIGDRDGNLRRAIVAIGRQMRLTGVSSAYESEPMYLKNQAWFLNCVVAVESELGPRELLARMQAIELEMGRERSVRYGPRTIDLDILFYGDQVLSEPSLEIPHPRIAERAFVLVPLNEIRPDLVHPVLGRSVSELLRDLKTAEKVIRRPGVLVDLASSSSTPRRP